MDKIFDASEADRQEKLEVNLVDQTITILSSNESESFEINAYKKECLINGYDDIDYLLNSKDKIEEFEKNRTYYF